MPRTRDDVLLERYRSTRDAGALAELYDGTAVALLRVAMHLARRPAEAEDLVQATFLAAIESIDAYEPGRPALGWLLGILHHKAHALWKREARVLDPERVARPASVDPLDATLAAELTQQVDEAIEKLPAAYQPVLRLHLGHKLTAAAIAHALARPAGTVRTQLVRGLELLRAVLPVGVAGAVFALLPQRGLAAVREIVVAKAAATGASVATAAGLIAGHAWLGGTILMKKLIVGGLVGLLLFVAALVWWPVTEPARQPPSPHSTTLSVAAAESPAAEVASSAPTTREPLPEKVAADAFGSARVRVVWDSDDTPAVGVWAYCVPWAGDNHRIFAYLLQTDARGEFACADIPPGKFTVYLEYGPGASLDIEPGAHHAATIRIPKGIHVDGVVVDASGTAVADAAVELNGGFGPQRQYPPVVRTDGAGRFRLRDVEKGVSIAATARGHAPSAYVHPSGEPGDTVALTLTLTGPGGTIEGQVRDHAGRPVASAMVEVKALDATYGRTSLGGMAQPLGPLSLRTDVAGMFKADGVAAGRVRVQARSPASATAERAVLLAAGQTQHVELTLEREATVSGTVRDETGAPVVGARVGIGIEHTEFANCVTNSLADGSFRLRGATAGAAKVWARAGTDPTVRRAGATLTLAAGEDHPCDLVVAPPAPATQVRGRVVDSKGEPLPGWRLSFRPTGWSLPWGASATTDALGAFAVGNCPPSVEVSLSAPTGELPVLEQDGIAPGGPDLVLRIPDELKTPATLTGRIVDESGAPLKGARISVHPTGRRMGASCESAADGTFSDTLPALRYAISIAVPDRPHLYLPELDLSAGQDTDLGTVRLARSGALVARIIDPDGKAIAPAHVRVCTRGNHVVTDLDGDGSREGSLPLAPGRYVLHVDHPRVAQERIAFEIEAGKETVVSAKLRPGFACVLHMRVESDQPPLAKPRWSLRDATGREVDGGVWIAKPVDMNIHLRLAPGLYVFECEDDQGRRAGGGVEVTAAPASVGRSQRQEYSFTLR